MNKLIFPQFLLKPELIICALLVLTTLWIYYPVSEHDFINYDDGQYVFGNYNVKKGLTSESIKWAFFTFEAANWHPVTWLSHMFDCQIYGINPGKHHITNVILHIFNTLLLFYVLLMSTERVWHSAFIAAFFAIHPMHVESVAWIAERKEVLSSFFMFITLIFYITYVKSQEKISYWAALFFFALGLMSKPMIVTLPFLLILFDYWPLERLKLSNRDDTDVSLIKNLTQLIIEKIPFFILTGASCYLTIMAQGASGAIANFDKLPLYIRLCNAAVAYCAYIKKMFNPVDLALFYPYPAKPDWFIVTLSLSVLLSISFFVIYLAKKCPWLISGWFWYIGTLVPVVGIVQVGSQSMADRYSYVPYTGLFIIIVFGIYKVFIRWPKWNFLSHSILGVFAVFLIYATSFQVKLWKNSITVFSHAIKVTRNNSVAHINLGDALINQNRIPEAIHHFSEALSINPNSAVAHLNIGHCYLILNQYDKALQSFSKSVSLKPDFSLAYYNIGYAYLRQHRYSESADYFMKTIKLNPYYAKAYHGMGILYHEQGDNEKAMLYLDKAYTLGSDEAKNYIDKFMTVQDKQTKKIN